VGKSNIIRALLANIVKEAERKPWGKFFQTRTTTPYIDEMIANPEYYESAKGLRAFLSQAPPSKYFDRAAIARPSFEREYGQFDPQVARWLGTSQERRMVDEDLVKEYLERAQMGEKMPMPYIDFKSGNQEGRHRARVAEILRLEDMPSILIRKTGME
jgi:hypothetical protein